jgi:hypothetical protein
LLAVDKSRSGNDQLVTASFESAARKVKTIVTRTVAATSYTLVPEDSGNAVRFTATTTITITVPTGLGAGFNTILFQDGAGAINLAGSGGTLINGQVSLNGLSTTQGQSVGLIATQADRLIASNSGGGASPVPTALGWTEGMTRAEARTALGLGDIATVNKSFVDITGGYIDGMDFVIATQFMQANTSIRAQRHLAMVPGTDRQSNLLSRRGLVLSGFSGAAMFENAPTPIGVGAANQYHVLVGHPATNSPGGGDAAYPVSFVGFAVTDASWQTGGAGIQYLNAARDQVKFEVDFAGNTRSVGKVSGAFVAGGNYTVAQLTTALAASAGLGVFAFATNGRKSGEAAEAGTGCPVWSNGGQWLTFYDNTVVAA